MNHYAAIDVSLELASVCIVDATGKVVKETKVETRPEALVKFFRDFGLPLTRIGLEAGPLSQWLYACLTDAGFETTLMETRHVKAALSATSKLHKAVLDIVRHDDVCRRLMTTPSVGVIVASTY